MIWGVGVVSPPGPDVGDAVPEEAEVGLEVVLGVGTTVLLELEDGEEVGCPVLELVAISVGEEVGTVVGYSVGTSVGTSVGAAVEPVGEWVNSALLGYPVATIVGLEVTTGEDGATVGAPVLSKQLQLTWKSNHP